MMTLAPRRSWAIAAASIMTMAALVGCTPPKATYAFRASPLEADHAVALTGDEIMGRGFVFSNPNASTTCGCGSSFSA